MIEGERGRGQHQYEFFGHDPSRLVAVVHVNVVRRHPGNAGLEVVNRTVYHKEVLEEEGLQKLPRNQTRKYSRDQKVARVAFAKAVLQTTPAVLRASLSMSLDGVVLSMPPSNETERYNYCWGVASHTCRKQANGNLP